MTMSGGYSPHTAYWIYDTNKGICCQGSFTGFPWFTNKCDRDLPDDSTRFIKIRSKHLIVIESIMSNLPRGVPDDEIKFYSDIIQSYKSRGGRSSIVMRFYVSET